MASQITGVSSACSTICLFKRRSKKHQSSALLAFVRGIHWWPVVSHKEPVTRKMFPFDDVILYISCMISYDGIYVLFTYTLSKVYNTFKKDSWLLFLYTNALFINSLGPSYAIWRQRSGSTLAQVMACWLTANVISDYIREKNKSYFMFSYLMCTSTRRFYKWT